MSLALTLTAYQPMRSVAKGYRIGFGEQGVFAEEDVRRIFAEAWAYKEAVIARRLRQIVDEVL